MLKSLLLCALLIGVTALPCRAQDDTPPVPPPVLNDHALLKKYVWSTLGAPGALHASLASALDQWRGEPTAWGEDVEGYGKRWLSEFAASAIGSTTKYTVARMLHQDPSFVRCECTGWAPRLRHSALSPFTARLEDGRAVLSPATVAGLAAENIIPAATWYPAERGTRDGLIHAASGIASKVCVDVFREFFRWPLRAHQP